jgi:hypothetical protein
MAKPRTGRKGWFLTALLGAMLIGGVSFAAFAAKSPDLNLAATTDNADWLPLKIGSGKVIVGCTWNNGCDNGYHGTSGRGPAIDFWTAIGTPVYAAGSGNLTGHWKNCNATGSPGCNGAAGNYITIAHAGGRTSRYLHLKSFARANGSVKKGQLIGYSGNSGNSADPRISPPHLHYDETVNNVKVDPGSMYAQHGSTRVKYPQAINSSYTSWRMVPKSAKKTVWNDWYGTKWEGKIVQQVNPGRPNTSWTVTSDWKKHWIPTTTVYYCKLNGGYANAGVIPAGDLARLTTSSTNASC